MNCPFCKLNWYADSKYFCTSGKKNLTKLCTVEDNESCELNPANEVQDETQSDLYGDRE